jgi:two-component system OmpR family response regulator
MFSAMADDVDRIVVYEVGADHYLPKPCAPRELLAWVRAVLRRRRRTMGDRQPTPAYAFAGWRLDPVQLTLTSPDGAATVTRAS